MTLFEGNVPDLDGPMPADMSEAEYLTRSTREPIQRVRMLLTDWASRYPEAYRSRLKGEILSSRDVQHKGAFFELFLHEYLIRNGYVIQVHPTVRGTDRVPDYLCTKENVSFYLEATICARWPANQAAAIKRLDTVIQSINTKVRSDSFYLSLSTYGMPDAVMCGRPIVHKLNNWLSSLDYDACKSKEGQGGYEKLEIEECGCKLVLTAMPHKNNYTRIIAAEMRDFNCGWSSPHLPIRDAIERKAHAYGDLNLPYIIAVNTYDAYANLRTDALSAVYGSECVSVSVNDTQEDNLSISRMRDGGFGHAGHPRKQNVSSVLVFNGIGSCSLANKRGIYIPNVFTTAQMDRPFLSMSHYHHEGDYLRYAEGHLITSSLDLPSNWPLHDLPEYA